MQVHKEQNTSTFENLFNTESYDPIIINENNEVLENESIIDNSRLDKIMKIIKWIFFFVPGCLILHLAILGGVFLFSIDYSSLSDVLIIPVLFSIGMFLMMLGMEKLRDLRYLKVIALTAAASFIFSIILLGFSLFSGISFFSIPFTLQLLFIVLIGQLSKYLIDSTFSNSDKLYN